MLGFDKTFKHLAGHEVELSRTKTTQPGFIEKIANEGMPQHQYSSFYGDLYVKYNVKYPKKLKSSQIKSINIEFFL